MELKHIVGYLPHGLKCLSGVSPILKNEFVWEILGFEKNKDSSLGFSVKAIRNDYKNTINIWPIKPILRPLSDLTKEIEVNDEKFVPIEYFENKYFTLDIHKQCERILEDQRWINHCEHLLIEYLDEWLFDRHGLIAKGEAIDINTLNK